MTGNKVKSRFFLGILLCGLFLGYPLMANAQVTTQEELDARTNQRQALENTPLKMVGGAYGFITGQNKRGEKLQESIEADKKAGIHKGNELRDITDKERRLLLDKEKALRSDKDAVDARKNLREAESESGFGSRLWGGMTNWARSEEGLEKRARMLADENPSSEAAKKASEGFNKRIQASVAEDVAEAEDVSVYTTISRDGESMQSYVNKDLTAVSGVMKGCIPMMVKFDQNKKCIFCPLFVVLFNTAQSMSMASYDKLAAGFAKLMLVGFALYIAFVSLKQVSAFTKQDGPKFVSETLVQSFKVLLAYLILTNVSFLYDNILSPMLYAGIEFGASFLFRSKPIVAAGAEMASSSGVRNIDFVSCTETSVIEGITVAKGYFQEALLAKIDCFIRAVQQEISLSQSLGSSLMCVARNGNAHWYGMWDLTMMMSGLIVWIFSWLICLAFAFYLIDAVVRLGIVGALMPFLIAAWPYKITRGYTSKGWAMFMNSFFTFVFLGMVVSINIELSSQALTGGEGGMEKIEALMNQDSINELNEVMSIGFTGLLFLILCCIFGFKLCAEAISLASSMADAKGDNIGSKLGSLAGASAKWATMKTGKTVGKGAMLAGEATGVNQFTRDKKNQLMNSSKNVARKFGQKLGFVKPVAGAASGGAGGENATAENTGRTNSEKQKTNEQPDNNKDNNTNQDAAAAQNAQPNQSKNQGDDAAKGKGNEANVGVNKDGTSGQPAAAQSANNADNQGQPAGASQQTDSKTNKQNIDNKNAVNAAPRNADAKGEANRQGIDKSGIKSYAETTAKAEADKKAKELQGKKDAKKDDKNGGNQSGAKEASTKRELEANQQAINALNVDISILQQKIKELSSGSGGTATSNNYIEKLEKLEKELEKLKRANNK